MADTRLFVYGTLMIPEVVQALLGRSLKVEPAELLGFQRVRLRTRIYPGVIPRPAMATSGHLWESVGDNDLALLDCFEGNLYRRVEVNVKTAANATLQAMAYVLSQTHHDLVINEAWNLAAFTKSHAAPYVTNCRRFRQDFLSGQG